MQSNQESALSPQAKQWLLRIATSAIVGGVVLFLSQN